MTSARQTVAEKLASYLRHEIPLAQLVDWAENAVMDGEFAPDGAPMLTRAAARMGVADVRVFGLTWEDCEQLLGAPGCAARIELVPA